jgi:hypothetical protein
MERAVGAIVGSAVGDALGAPFEFGPAGAFSTRFPRSGSGEGEMCGGGGWEAGEATDDTQMAVHVGESLLERGGLDLPDIFARFQRWAASDPKDIGLRLGQHRPHSWYMDYDWYMSMKRTNVYADPEDLAIIKEAAARRGISEAEIIRQGIHLAAMANRVWDEPLFSRTFKGSGRTPSKDDVRNAVADAVQREARTAS